MNAPVRLGSPSPKDLRRDNTTYVRDIRTGQSICTFNGRNHAFDAINDCPGGPAFGWASIQHGDCEGVEYITVDGVPVAWIDEPPHSFLTDEIEAALFPMQMAAE